VPDDLDLGRLLRLRAMLSAAQIEPTADAGRALVRAYNNLVIEGSGVLTRASAELKQDYERLFPPLEEPDDHLNATRMAQGAAEASLKIRLLGGWVQGLIDELTMDQRMRMEAVEMAKVGTKPPTGFRV